MKQRIFESVTDRPAHEIAHRLGIDRDVAEKLLIAAIHLINLPEYTRELWAVNIMVTYLNRRGGMWHAYTEVMDEHFADDLGVNIEIKSRYYCKSLADVIDNVLDASKQLGIMWGRNDVEPKIYYKDDGLSKEFPPPKGWNELLNNQAGRIGWEPAYEEDE